MACEERSGSVFCSKSWLRFSCMPFQELCQVSAVLAVKAGLAPQNCDVQVSIHLLLQIILQACLELQESLHCMAKSGSLLQCL